MANILLPLFSLIFLKNVFSMKIVVEQRSDGFSYVNSELVNKTDNIWQTRKLIMCTQCTLEPGTVVAFQAYFRNAVAVKPLQFSVWAPDLQGMTLLNPNSTTKIYRLLLTIDYDPSTLGRRTNVGCNNGIHTIIIPPGQMRTVNSSALIGVIVQPTSSIVYNFNNDPDGSGLSGQLRFYDNLFDNTRLSPGESRQFGNLGMQEEVAFGGITYPKADISFDEQNTVAATLARLWNCSTNDTGIIRPTTTPAPSATEVTIDQIDRVTPPKNPDGYNLGNDASCNGPTPAAIRSLAQQMQEPQMKIFIFAALSLPTGVVNGFQVCVGREVKFSGEGFRFQVWRRVQGMFSLDGVQDTNVPGAFFRLIGQTEKYQPEIKKSYTYLLEAKDRFNVTDGDYFGFVNYGNETIISSIPSTKGDPMAAVAYYELSNVGQSLLQGEAYKFNEVLLFSRYAASIMINTNTTDPSARTPFDGPTGPQGAPGTAVGGVGPVGAKGDQGDQGAPGAKGPVGDAGPQGGPQGTKGQKGDPGMGAQKGEPGTTGTPGQNNSQKGAKGPTGVKGAKGDKGDRGDSGKQGQSGTSGDTGATGRRGDRGDMGPANTEAVNITKCSADAQANLSCPTVHGECDLIERYTFIPTSNVTNNDTSFPAKLSFKSQKNECRCAPGYQLNGTACANVNECAVMNGGCEFLCNDSDGSYTCGCPPGLQLAADKLRCTDIDECQPNPCDSGDICLNRYRATEALCMHSKSVGVVGKQVDDPSSASPTSSTSVFYTRGMYIGLIIWLAILSAILIVIIVLLAIFYLCRSKSDGDANSLKSFDLTVNPTRQPRVVAANNSLPEWAAEMKEDTYMQHQDNGVTNRAFDNSY